jgi:hypothetical protein
VNARELFEQLAPLVAPALEQAFDRRDLCILAARVAIETAAYFGIEATPVAVKVMAYNDSFARHLADKDVDFQQPCSTWGDDSWAVGIGCGKPPDCNRWDGHLIAVADGCFGDFSIQQAERLERNIHTGPALVGPYTGQMKWKAIEGNSGTVVEYSRIADDFWRSAPDWRDAKRRRPIVAALIRTVRAMELTAR